MKKIGFIVQFLCLALFSFGQSAEEGIRFIEGEKWENILIPWDCLLQKWELYVILDLKIRMEV